MKRILTSLLLIIVFLSLISCDGEIKNNSNNSSSPNGGGATDQGITYIVPFFATDKPETALQSRGLTSMPVGEKWGNDAWRSSAIMQYLPAMIGFEEIKRNNFEEVKSEAADEGLIRLIGFNVKADTSVWKENNDGFYMKYDILSNDDSETPVGMIQYYYNKNSNSFSYRQLVMLTYLMDIPNGSQNMSTETFVFSLEFNDIPVHNINQVRGFEFGSLDNDGHIERNAFVDYIHLKNTDHSYTKPGVSFYRRFISGTSDKNLFQAFSHPDLDRNTNNYDDQRIADLINKLPGEGLPDIIDTVVESKAADLDFIFSVIPYFYKNADTIIANDYSSFEDFNDSSFMELKDLVESKIVSDPSEGSSNASANPVIFSWSQNASASAQTTDPDTGFATGSDFDNVTVEKLDKTDFLKFYPELRNLSGQDLVDKLIELHLYACGITNETYIKNYQYANKVTYHGHGPLRRWPYEITTENHEEFKANFDEAIKPYEDNSY